MHPYTFRAENAFLPLELRSSAVPAAPRAAVRRDREVPGRRRGRVVHRQPRHGRKGYRGRAPLPLYDDIGHGYARTREADPRIAAAIDQALGDARTVVNVGAGAGSYEPADRAVTAVEPSQAMIDQRPPGAAPCLRAAAEELPFADDSFDAALAVDDRAPLG